MDDEELVSVADELYSSPIDTFTATRNARAAEAKMRGAGDLAAAIRALPKPSAAAWAANLLARRSADALTSLAFLRDRIQSITTAGDRDDLRTTSRDRHALVSRLLDDARSLAAEAGRALSDPAADDVADALLAALGDADVAAVLATGRLISVPRTGGMTPEDIHSIVAVPPDGLAIGRDDTEDDPDDDAVEPDDDVRRRRPGSTTGPGTSGSRHPARRVAARSVARRQRLEGALAAAEEAETAAHGDRAQREAERDDLVGRRDQLRDDLKRKREAVRLAERELGDVEDHVDSLTADIRSRELEWKRAEATARRVRRELDEWGDAPGS